MEDILGAAFYTVASSLTLLIGFVFLKCFYDDSIHMTGKRLLLYFLLDIPIGGLFWINLYTGCFNLSVTLNRILMILLPLVCQVLPVAIFCTGRGKGVWYYLKKLFLAGILGFYVMVALLTVVLTMQSILSLLNIISFGSFTFLRIASLLLIGLMLLWLYLMFVRREITLRMRKRDTFFFVVHFVLSVFAMWVDGSKISVEWVDIRILIELYMMITLVLLPAMVIMNRLSAYYNELSTRREQYIESELISSGTYKAAQEETRAFRHDMKNQLQIFSTMLHNGQYSEAEAHLKELGLRIDSFSQAVVTGDDMLDALLSSKIPTMKEKGITFQCEGVIEGGLQWKPIDICAVFANLIDNAIEACDKVTEKERYISVDIRKTEFQRVITFRNSTAEKVDIAQLESDLRYTSKADRSCHGYGVKNIRTTLEKNGAMMQMNCTDEEFSTQIMFAR